MAGGPDALVVRVFDLSGTELFRESKSAGTQSFGVYPTVDFSVTGVSAVGGLIVQFGENPYWVGADKLRFQVAPSAQQVPEPVGRSLLLSTLAALALMYRRAHRRVRYP